MSFTIRLNATESVLAADFFPPINLSCDYEIGLIGLSAWNSIANINESNNLFHYDGNKHIEIEPGSYKLEDIENFLNLELKERHQKNPLPDTAPKALIEQPLYITGNHQTLRSEIYCRCKIDFERERNLGSILGFNPAKLDAFKKYESDNVVNILQVESIRVQCNIVHYSFSNGEAMHTLYEFFPDVSPGYKIL